MKKLVIPEGSAIVTAKKNLNKKAVTAYNKGDDKTLEKIIKKMPADKSDNKAVGTRKLRGGYVNVKNLPKSPPVNSFTNWQNASGYDKPLDTKTGSIARMDLAPRTVAKTTAPSFNSDMSLDAPTGKPKYTDIFKNGATPISPLTATQLAQAFIPTPKAPYNPVALTRLKPYNNVEQQLSEINRAKTTQLAYQGVQTNNANQKIANSIATSNAARRDMTNVINTQAQRNQMVANQNVDITNRERMYNTNMLQRSQEQQQQINAGKLNLVQDFAQSLTNDMDANQRMYHQMVKDYNMSEQEKQQLKTMLSAFRIFGLKDGEVALKTE